MATLEEYLQQFNIKQLQSVIKKHNINTKITAGKTRADLLKSILEHFESIVGDELVSKIYKQKIPEGIKPKVEPEMPLSYFQRAKNKVSNLTNTIFKEQEVKETAPKRKTPYIKKYNVENRNYERENENMFSGIENEYKKGTMYNPETTNTSKYIMTDKDKDRIKSSEEPEKPKSGLKIDMRIPKEGDYDFIHNFAKLTKIEQLDSVLKGSSIIGNPPDKAFYESVANDFYNNINVILNKSPYKAVKILVENFGLEPKLLRALYQSAVNDDFYTTSRDMFDEITTQMHNVLKGKNVTHMLEGTAGIGNVAYWFKQKYPHIKVTVNELNKSSIEIMKKFLKLSDYTFLNKDFFDLEDDDFLTPGDKYKEVNGELKLIEEDPHGKPDLIFLNPPFTKTGNDYYWFDFLLQSLNLGKSISTSECITILISPPLTRAGDYSGGASSGNEMYLEGLQSLARQNKGSIPNNKWLEAINKEAKREEEGPFTVAELEDNSGNSKLDSFLSDYFNVIQASYWKMKATDFGGTTIQTNWSKWINR
jgi:hypothetical protein